VHGTPAPPLGAPSQYPPAKDDAHFTGNRQSNAEAPHANAATAPNTPTGSGQAYSASTLTALAHQTIQHTRAWHAPNAQRLQTIGRKTDGNW
jgi:hypothetical protein